jgi:transcriptional regulator with XRE-family HTH domain
MEEKELSQFFASKLKELRLEKGYTQKELGHLLGLSDAAITQYEKGKREPKRALLYELAEIFGVQVECFFPPNSSKDSHEPIQEWDDDALEILEMLNDDRDLKMLFKKTGKLSKEDKERIVRILKATLPPNHDDGC